MNYQDQTPTLKPSKLFFTDHGFDITITNSKDLSNFLEMGHLNNGILFLVINPDTNLSHKGVVFGSRIIKEPLSALVSMVSLDYAISRGLLNIDYHIEPNELNLKLLLKTLEEAKAIYPYHNISIMPSTMTLEANQKRILVKLNSLGTIIKAHQG